MITMGEVPAALENSEILINEHQDLNERQVRIKSQLNVIYQDGKSDNSEDDSNFLEEQDIVMSS